MTPDLSTLLPFMGICALFLLAGVAVGLLWHAATTPVEPEQLDDHDTGPITREMRVLPGVPTNTQAIQAQEWWA